MNQSKIKKNIGKIFFTKNGIKITVEKIPHISSGTKLYPIVGSRSNGSKVKVNFGQVPFKFAFSDYLKDVISKKNPVKEDLFSKRKELAKDLSRDMGFSYKLSIKALELNKDDPNTAVSWLLDSSGDFLVEHPEFMEEEGDIEVEPNEEKKEPKVKHQLE